MRILPTTVAEEKIHRFAESQMIRMIRFHHDDGYHCVLATEQWIANVPLKIVRPIKMEIYC